MARKGPRKLSCEGLPRSERGKEALQTEGEGGGALGLHRPPSTRQGKETCPALTGHPTARRASMPATSVIAARSSGDDTQAGTLTGRASPTFATGARISATPSGTGKRCLASIRPLSRRRATACPSFAASPAPCLVEIERPSSLSYSRRSVSGPLWAFAAAGCIARTTGIAGVCFTAFGLMGFSG